MKIDIDTRLIPRIRELEKENERLREAIAGRIEQYVDRYLKQDTDRYVDIGCCEISDIIAQHKYVDGVRLKCLFCNGQQECLDYPFVRVSARVYANRKEEEQ